MRYWNDVIERKYQTCMKNLSYEYEYIYYDDDDVEYNTLLRLDRIYCDRIEYEYEYERRKMKT